MYGINGFCLACWDEIKAEQKDEEDLTDYEDMADQQDNWPEDMR